MLPVNSFADTMSVLDKISSLFVVILHKKCFQRYNSLKQMLRIINLTSIHIIKYIAIQLLQKRIYKTHQSLQRAQL